MVAAQQGAEADAGSPGLYLGGWAESGVEIPGSQAHRPRSLAPPLGVKVDRQHTEREMKRMTLAAGLLSSLIPGLGQMSCGEANKDATILGVATISGNLNITSTPASAAADTDPGVVWAHWIPAVGHELASLSSTLSGCGLWLMRSHVPRRRGSLASL